jgi:hypothetical protein
MQLGKDLLLVRGCKPHWMPTRQVSISEIWIIDPELDGPVDEPMEEDDDGV